MIRNYGKNLFLLTCLSTTFLSFTLKQGIAMEEVKGDFKFLPTDVLIYLLHSEVLTYGNILNFSETCKDHYKLVKTSPLLINKRNLELKKKAIQKAIEIIDKASIGEPLPPITLLSQFNNLFDNYLREHRDQELREIVTLRKTEEISASEELIFKQKLALRLLFIRYGFSAASEIAQSKSDKVTFEECRLFSISNGDSETQAIEAGHILAEIITSKRELLGKVPPMNYAADHTNWPTIGLEDSADHIITTLNIFNLAWKVFQKVEIIVSNIAKDAATDLLKSNESRRLDDKMGFYRFLSYAYQIEKIEVYHALISTVQTFIRDLDKDLISFMENDKTAKLPFFHNQSTLQDYLTNNKDYQMLKAELRENVSIHTTEQILKIIAGVFD